MVLEGNSIGIILNVISIHMAPIFKYELSGYNHFQGNSLRKCKLYLWM
jgi:hypothetical protein